MQCTVQRTRQCCTIQCTRQCTDGTLPPLPPQEDDCPPGRCGKLTKPFLGTYYGAGNYFYVARLLRLASHTGTVFLSADDFAAAAHRACAVPWLQTRAEWNATAWLHVRLGCSPPATLRTQAATLRAQAATPRLQAHALHPRCASAASRACTSRASCSTSTASRAPRGSSPSRTRCAGPRWNGRWAGTPPRRPAAPPPRRPAATPLRRYAATQAHASAEMLPQCCPPPVLAANYYSLMVACCRAACCTRSRSRAQQSS